MTGTPRLTLTGTPLIVHDDPTPRAWRGVGGHLHDPQVRAARGTVRRARTRRARRTLRAAVWAGAALAAVAAVYLLTILM